MTKVILKLFTIIFFLFLSFVGYFSLIGFETKSFNNQIKENLKKVNSKLDVKINDVKIILDLFNLKINTKTIGPIISYNNKSIDLELIKSEIGWGHQIRSYVLQPYQLVKDNRTNFESTNPKKILDGEIDEFLERSLYQI